MKEQSALTPRLLRALAELKGLDLDEELSRALLPLVTDLLAMADSLKESDIWKSAPDDPLDCAAGEQ